MKRFILRLLFLSSFFVLTAQPPELSTLLEESNLYINGVPTSDPNKLSLEERLNLAFLINRLDNGNQNEQFPSFHYVLKSCDSSTGEVIFEEGLHWTIGWWYRSALSNWKAGDKIRIYFHKAYDNHTRLENLNASNDAWGVHASLAESALVIQQFNQSGSTATLKVNGLNFEGKFTTNLNWREKDRLVIYHKEGSKQFTIWNLAQGIMAHSWTLTNKSPADVYNNTNINFDLALQLEDRLNRRIIGQPEASKAVSEAILNYCVGLKDPKTPIGVFLFLGPTGVGKTELAKSLAQELHGNSNSFVRFDMSHFSEPHSVARLIGSPPGYVNHEEGGQLTEAIKKNPYTVVLLDEIEKAHPTVHKLFLPVFDEGYITDAKDKKIPCNHAIFIMTSNLCSFEIQKLFNMCFESEEVLEQIEPILIQRLSPELYSRMEAVIFHPLDQAAIQKLVDINLADIIRKLRNERNIELSFDESVREYLIENGFHPTLGARPLKKLIQKKVLAKLAHAIIKDRIPSASKITLSYEATDDSWLVTWSSIEN